MRLKKRSSVDYVHQFSDIAYMKFIPEKLNVKYEQPQKQQQSVIMSRIKSIINWRSPQQTNTSRVSATSARSALSRSSSQVSIKSISLQNDVPGSTIIFLQKISPQYFLIGNENQVDLVYIGGVVGNFIDTQRIWALNIGYYIKNLAIQTKKGYIALQTNSSIHLYKYDNKKIRQKAQFVYEVKTKQQGQYLRFVKDEVLAVFYRNLVDVYVIQQNKMRKKMNKQIKQATQMTLFQVPFALQNCINVFYTKKSQTTKTFQLWFLQINFRGFQIQISPITKVYDIKQGLQRKIKLENYSRQIFLMNLGFQILAVKKGYIIDSAYLNIQSQSTFLHYIGNNRLLHLSPFKAQIYRFKIDFSNNPPRIQINSLDSIDIKKPADYEYVGALEMFDKNFAVFYQIVPNHNRRTKGQITYCFAITKHVTIQQKINQIFNFGLGIPLKDVPLQIIQEKVDMAKKIGLTRIQTYLQLWNRTNKTQVQQFKFLLDTLDYETIKEQIQKKLKKSSMLFREVYKIQQSCFDMIKYNLFSSKCTQQVVRHYLKSHFLLRKLQLYRDITMAERKNNPKIKTEEQDNDALKVNIQNYNKFLKADIKNLFLQLIHQYCCQEKDVLIQIRMFLRSFRFIFRIIYKPLLQDIVSTTKNSLIKLLQNFPQLLPYKHLLNQNDDATLYQGVWQDISRTEWQRNNYLEGISTIDNREVITQMLNPATLWFRRDFLTMHDMTGKSKQQIIKINKLNNSDSIFYFFISNVFQHVTDTQALNKIITFVQRNYQKMPTHLHRKIFLYRKIYEFMRDKSLSKDNQRLKNFHDLLQMKDFELFKEFFDFQKTTKGCLLGKIKNIYEQIGGQQQNHIDDNQLLSNNHGQYELKSKKIRKGRQWFKEGILSYFESQLSQISDLKYILNRINNQKLEFHLQNEDLIYVLIQSVQLKLKIGSQNDVPISQVLVYLQNIPLTQDSPAIAQLQKIQKISKQVQRFQQIKINMTISEITKNCQNVINALVNAQIRKRDVMEVTSEQQMRELSYDILAQIQVVKEQIYTLEYSDLTFFVYLTKIMEQVHMIPYASMLLNDKFLKKHYSIDLKIVQDLILYMYKKKLTQNPKYIENEYYLNNLLQILPEDNQLRTYITCQIQYAKILSAQNNLVEYPITDKSDLISIVQVQERIQQLPSSFVLQIDVIKLHQLINKMQQICYQDLQQNLYTTINQIYQTIILKLIQDNKVVSSIPIARKLLQIPNNQYSIIFPIIYIEIISQELTLQCKKNFLKTVSYLFNEPIQLLNIVEQVIGKVFTNQQRDTYFRQLAEKSTQLRRNYNAKNPILDQIYLELIRNQEMQNNFRNMIDQCGHHLVRTKQEFNNFQFSLLFVILTQQPFALGKYIFCKRYHLNYKVMRSFLSYVIKEQIFSSMRVLQFGRRLFKSALQASQTVLTYESIASQYSTLPIDQNYQFQELIPVQPVYPEDDQLVKKAKILQSKLQKCIIAFDKKKNSVLSDINVNGPLQNLQKKKQRIQRQLINPVDLSQKAPSQYPFGDSDDDYGEQQKFEDFTKSLRRKKKHKQFNPTAERNMLLNRTNKNYALFMSSQLGQKQDPLFLSTRGGMSYHRIVHKNTKALAMDGSNSLRFSEGLNSHSVQPISRRLGQHHTGGISEQMKLTQSIQGFNNNWVSKSTYLQKRKSANLQRQYEQISPLINHSMDQSKQLQDGQINLENHDHDKQFIQDRLQKQGPEELLKLSNYQNQEQIRSIKKSGVSFHVYVQQVDQNAFLQINKLKQMILQSVSEEGEQFCIDLGQLSLQQDKDNGSFYDYVKDLIKSIYQDASIKSKTKLNIIKQIQSLYPDLGIAKQYLDIYVRFQSYHSKYDISIPIYQMFPIQCIYSDNKEPKHLFDNIVSNIAKLVDQSNIYKISKIIHLAFKASSFQHQFFFQYLCLASIKFDQSTVSQNQLNMQLQKLTALIDKLPIHIVVQRANKMIQKMKRKQRKQKIIQSMVQYVKKKKSSEELTKFQNSLKAK